MRKLEIFRFYTNSSSEHRRAASILERRGPGYGSQHQGFGVLAPEKFRKTCQRFGALYCICCIKIINFFLFLLFRFLFFLFFSFSPALRLRHCRTRRNGSRTTSDVITARQRLTSVGIENTVKTEQKYFLKLYLLKLNFHSKESLLFLLYHFVPF